MQLKSAHPHHITCFIKKRFTAKVWLDLWTGLHISGRILQGLCHYSCRGRFPNKAIIHWISVEMRFWWLYTDKLQWPVICTVIKDLSSSLRRKHKSHLQRYRPGSICAALHLVPVPQSELKHFNAFFLFSCTVHLIFLPAQPCELQHTDMLRCERCLRSHWHLSAHGDDVDHAHVTAWMIWLICQRSVSLVLDFCSVFSVFAPRRPCFAFPNCVLSPDKGMWAFNLQS